MNVLGLLLFGVLPGAFLVFIGVGHLWNYVRMRRITPTDIRDVDATTGEVELTGTARVHEETSRSPFTDTRTLIHEWKVKGYSSSGSDGPSWPQLDSGDATHAFLLEDETGTVLVDPEGATPYLRTTTTIEVAPDESPPPAVAQFLQSSDEFEPNTDRTYRYTESRLDPKSDVHVFGPVREVGSSANLPASVDAVIGVEASKQDRTLNDLTLSAIVDQLTTGPDQFIITNAGESGAERQMLTIGGVSLGVGLLFMGVSGLLLVG